VAPDADDHDPLTLPIVSIAFLFGIVFTFTDLVVVYVLTRAGR